MYKITFTIPGKVNERKFLDYDKFTPNDVARYEELRKLEAKVMEIERENSNILARVQNKDDNDHIASKYRELQHIILNETALLPMKIISNIEQSEEITLILGSDRFIYEKIKNKTTITVFKENGTTVIYNDVSNLSIYTYGAMRK